MCCLNILNPQSINFKFTNCFLWHQLLALLFIKICGCLLIVYFSSVPTVTVGYDFKNICLFKEIFTSYRYFTSLEQVTHFCPVSLIYVLISKPLPRLLVAILSQQGHKKKSFAIHSRARKRSCCSNRTEMKRWFVYAAILVRQLASTVPKSRRIANLYWSQEILRIRIKGMIDRNMQHFLLFHDRPTFKRNTTQFTA